MPRSENTPLQTRRTFLQNASLLAAALPLAKLDGFAAAAGSSTAASPTLPTNLPETLVSDPRVKLTFGPERMVMPDGLQPSMLCTSSGTLIVQSQLSGKPHPQERIFYPYALKTVVSRDGGEQWAESPLKPGDNGVDLEGGIIQLRDGTIIALETYVTAGDGPGKGAGLLYHSTDDWRTVQGPVDITLTLPGVNFAASTDDRGRPHAAMRLHRRILELPNGDLITTMLGWFEGDTEPSGYTPGLKKSRVVFLRSTNRGRHWDMISTVAAGTLGTEGFSEPVLVRITRGPRAGRLICQMRTGRDLHESISDDEGRSWSLAHPRVYANIDVYRTDLWIEMFRDVKRKGKPLVENPNEIIGAVVDPELLELRSGVLVAAFGVRIPARGCWTNPKHPWNGNYMAFSLNQGDTWSHVVRMTSGIFTTHYMAVEETPKDNHLFVVYDFGHWTCQEGRYTYGRPLTISASPI